MRSRWAGRRSQPTENAAVAQPAVQQPIDAMQEAPAVPMQATSASSRNRGGTGQKPARFVSWAGHWKCGTCGSKHGLRDACIPPGCNQHAAPCAAWFYGACTGATCTKPHLLFDMQVLSRVEAERAALLASGRKVAVPHPEFHYPPNWRPAAAPQAQSAQRMHRADQRAWGPSSTTPVKSQAAVPVLKETSSPSSPLTDRPAAFSWAQRAAPSPPRLPPPPLRPEPPAMMDFLPPSVFSASSSPVLGAVKGPAAGLAQGSVDDYAQMLQVDVHLRYA